MGPGSHTPADASMEASVAECAAQRRPASLRRLADAFDERRFDCSSWGWQKYGELMEERVAQLQLPPGLRFELSSALLGELRTC